MLFAAESGIELDYQLVDLFTGSHLKPEYAAINPNRQVPTLEEGDFHLTESATILRYLADKIGSPAYPSDLRKRALVNERLDWFNTGCYRDLGYGLAYPQLLPHHRRPSDEQQAGTLAWSKEKTRKWLEILDQNLIGPSNAYVCGNEISIADYFGAAIITVGEIIRCDFKPYPNIQRWLGNMRARPGWGKVNEAFNGWVGAVKATPFEVV